MAFGKVVGIKLSAKSFGWDKETILRTLMKPEWEGKELPLVRYAGTATGLRKYKSEYADGGEGFGLSGEFLGIGSDLAPKPERQDGSVLYLPGNVHAMVEAALDMSDASAVRIAFDVYAVYDKDAATSYVFMTRDVLNQGSTSADDILAQVANSAPAIGQEAPAQIENKRK